jgi:hypothetical protein
MNKNESKGLQKKYYKICSPIIFKCKNDNMPFKLSEIISENEASSLSRFFVGYYSDDQLMAIEKYDSGKLVFRDEYVYFPNKANVIRERKLQFMDEDLSHNFFYDENGNLKK